MSTVSEERRGKSKSGATKWEEWRCSSCGAGHSNDHGEHGGGAGSCRAPDWCVGLACYCEESDPHDCLDTYCSHCGGR